ncbi:hypothetical protein F5I97DRAFT_1852672 [Phlebopus sp. FC_14]|nr:hypothetical protein F5I97DRAFT_1852672 [Phlebopus sp. FC_14]
MWFRKFPLDFHLNCHPQVPSKGLVEGLPYYVATPQFGSTASYSGTGNAPPKPRSCSRRRILNLVGNVLVAIHSPPLPSSLTIHQVIFTTMSPVSCSITERPVLETVRLRVMKASDVPQVRALHSNLLPISYPPAFFVQLLLHPRHLCLVATHQESVIAFASAMSDATQPASLRRDVFDTDERREGTQPRPHSDIARTHITLLTLGVLPAYQRQGIGRTLVHDVVRRLQASFPALCSHPSVPDANDPSQERKAAVLVQAQVAHSNAAGKCFYSRLGMSGQCGPDDPRHNIGLAARTAVVAGIICV